MNPKNGTFELTHAEEHNEHDNDCCKLNTIDNSRKNDPSTYSKEQSLRKLINIEHDDLHFEKNHIQKVESCKIILIYFIF